MKEKLHIYSLRIFINIIVIAVLSGNKSSENTWVICGFAQVKLPSQVILYFHIS